MNETQDDQDVDGEMESPSPARLKKARYMSIKSL